MKQVNLDQRSSDWLTWRNTGIGSSDAATIVGLSKYKKNLDDLIRDKRIALGLLPNHVAHERSPLRKKFFPHHENAHMRRGRLWEPAVLEAYNRVFKSSAKPVCCIHESYSWAKASLDGYVEQSNLVIEIKCPNRLDHEEVLHHSRVPLHYLPQVHHQMLVTGAKLVHYVSYCEHESFLRQQQLLVLPVYRNQEQIDLLKEAELEFWNRVLTSN